jgi:hypothetical protein
MSRSSRVDFVEWLRVQGGGPVWLLTSGRKWSLDVVLQVGTQFRFPRKVCRAKLRSGMAKAAGLGAISVALGLLWLSVELLTFLLCEPSRQYVSRSEQHLRRVLVSFTNVWDMLAVLLCGDGRAYDRLRVPSHHRSAARAVRANDVRREISAESRFSGKCRRRYARFGADVVRRFAAGHRRF